MSSNTKLYLMKASPFSQKPWIALLEKGIKFEPVETNPMLKTPEWLAVNPRGLIPALVHNGRAIYESDIVVEYIHDAFPDLGPPLLPTDPFRRATMRIWLDYLNKNVLNQFYGVLLCQDSKRKEEFHQALLTAFKELAGAMDAEGPFFDGKYMSLLDIALIPFALRYEHVMGHYLGFKFPDTPDWARFHSWLIAMKDKPSVQGTIPQGTDFEVYIQIYAKYADGTATGSVADNARRALSF